ADKGPASPGLRPVVRDGADRGLAPPLPCQGLCLRPPPHPPDHRPRRRPVRGGLPGVPAGVDGAWPPRTADAPDPPRAIGAPGALDPSRGRQSAYRRPRRDRPRPRGRAVIRDVLPPDVVAVTFDELGMDESSALASLHPVEAEQVDGAVDSRRHDFAAARACAREAMRRLGIPGGPVVRGGRGMPVWPPGVVGSLTHTDGLRAAALAPADSVRSLGLDVEPHGPLPDGVLGAISLPDEAAWVDAARGEGTAVHWDRVLFTAK